MLSVDELVKDLDDTGRYLTDEELAFVVDDIVNWHDTRQGISARRIQQGKEPLQDYSLALVIHALHELTERRAGGNS